MAHMKPDITHITMIDVDTNAGSFLVPADVFDAADPLACTEGTKLYGTEEVTGWFARLSAPGYLDCTDWIGPYATEWEAKADLLDTYDVCPECGGNLDEDGSTCAECGSDFGELTDRPDYVGDVDYCHGGVWFNLADDWKYGYVSAVEVCSIPEHRGVLWVSHYTTLTPEAETVEDALEDEHVHEALRFCGIDADNLAECPNWRLTIASALFYYGRKDPDDFTPTMVILTEPKADLDDSITVDHRIPDGKALDLFLSERIDWVPAAE